MEFTFESALSPSGILGHASFLCLVISMLMRSMLWLRLFVIAASILNICYSVFILTDPVGFFWETLLIAVNTVQIARIKWKDRLARFTVEERALLDRQFAGLSPGRQRMLLDLGVWEDLAAGSVLSTEDQPVAALYYIAAGEVRITSGGEEVARCLPGQYVGELTVSCGSPATGTSVAVSLLRVWKIDAKKLRLLLERSPELGSALEASFFHSVRNKLVSRSAATAPSRFAQTTPSC